MPAGTLLSGLTLGPGLTLSVACKCCRRPSSPLWLKRLRGRAELRLAVISPFLDRQHGTELCITEQIERLARKDHWSIELYSQKISQLNGVRLASAVSPNEPGIIRWHQVSSIPGPHLLKYLWWFLANYWQRWRDRCSGRVRPDLVYSPGINCPDADVIVVHIVFHEFYERVRSELALHRLPLPIWPRAVHRKLYYKLAMFLEREIYSDPGVRLVAVSSLVAAQLKSHFQREDVTVIPNAVDTVRFTPEERMAKRSASRQSFSYDEGDFVLLLIGNDWKKKGLDTLLKAIGLLKNLPLRLLVVGSDVPGFYRQLVDQFALSDRVRFEKPSMDVLFFYAAADLYVGPSLEDSFGLPILEAMACGLPVIASANAGASELIRDGETGFILCNPRDHSELASLIRRIQAGDSLRQSMGAAASRYVITNCSWDDNAEKTGQLLESTLTRLRS
jgi:glycosyltransferase involved in cell wall biosynthesis